MDRGTLIVNLPQPDAPVQLLATKHATSDFLIAATLKNIGVQPFSGCRLGWVVVFASGSNEVHLSVPMNISAGIDRGAMWNVPAQSVSPEYAKQGAKVIAFFIAEAYPSRGEPWKADLAKLRQEAVRIALLAKS